MSIVSAVSELSGRIFGESPSFTRLGAVRADGGVLHVYTRVPPSKWPADRVKKFNGYPVMWHHTGHEQPEDALPDTCEP